MKCQEVMEYMQRYLDGDLNKEEQDAMTRHMDDCTSCTLMFQRLNRLSDELVNLPKVAPPFNIVDSILPKLEELDRLTDHEDRRASAWTRFWRGTPSKVIGGTIAASIIITLMMINNPLKGPAKEQADADLLYLEERAATFSGAAEGTRNDRKVVSQSANDGSKTNRVWAVDQAGEQVDKELEPNTKLTQDAAGFSQDSGTSLDDSLGNKVSESGSGTGKMPEAGRHESIQGPNDTPPAMAEAGGEAEPDDFFFSSNTVVTSQGFSGEHSLPLASPDGMYAAFTEFSDSGMQMIIVDQNGERIYASPVKQADELVDISWSETEYHLIYSVLNGDIETTYTIKVDNRLEMKHD